MNTERIIFYRDLLIPEDFGVIQYVFLLLSGIHLLICFNIVRRNESSHSAGSRHFKIQIKYILLLCVSFIDSSLWYSDVNKYLIMDSI